MIRLVYKFKVPDPYYIYITSLLEPMWEKNSERERMEKRMGVGSGNVEDPLVGHGRSDSVK